MRWLVLALAACCVFAASAQGAAPRASLGGAVAEPAGFVPDWDGGHSDGTDVTYRVAVTSDVTVVVLDARGVVRATLVRERQAPGLHVAVWSGRDAAGAVLPVGAYTVRVGARPVAAAAGGKSAGRVAARGNAAAVAVSRRDVAVALKAAPVTLRAVHLTRGSIGKARALAATRAGYSLSRAGFVNAAIVDGQGRVWRTLAGGPQSAGGHVAAWTGTDAAGAAVPDGMYELLVAASGGGRPTTTIRVPVRVDRTVPTLTVARTVPAKLSSGVPVLPLDVGVSEPSVVRVKVGQKGVKVVAKAGTRRFSIRGNTLGIKATKRARTVPVFVSATDSTGNVTAAKVAVQVPAAVKVVRPSRPAPPVANPTPAGPPVAADKLSWPLRGAVQINSPFGPRWQRNHSGIDLQASIGTPVYAAADGTVSYVGPMSGYGNLVIVNHPNALSTYYAHLTSAAAGLVVGDEVARGALLGLSGCTGTCTGPHLHFEVRVSGVARDPEPFLPAH